MTPVVEAYDDGHHTVLFCDWCAGWHRHGRGAEGDYVEHCWESDGPYSKTGYVIRLVGPMTDEVRAAHRERERAAKVALRERRRR